MNCLFCATSLRQPTIGRRRKFCNDRCRIAYHRYHTKLPTLPYDLDHCSACGTKRGNIIPDVDKATRERYGSLCTRCYNVIIQCANPTQLRSIANYLEHTHPPLSVSNERIRNYRDEMVRTNRQSDHLKEIPEMSL